MATRWGIAGAGKISNDFVNSLTVLDPAEHQVVAVAAQKLDRAKKFASEHNIPNAYDSYEQLAKDPNVEVVYVGNLNTQHFPVSKLMLENGKHVLCEKPICLNAKEAKELFAFAQSKKLFLMEAIWSRVFPVYKELYSILESGTLGEIHQVSAYFGAKIAEVERVSSPELGGGTILDLGIYVLQFQQLVFGKEKYSEVHASGILNKTGTDDGFAAVIKYPSGKIAVASTHSRVELQNEAYIIGTKGYVKIPQFWCPTKLITHEKTVEYKLPETDKFYNFKNSVGLNYEAQEVRRCIKAGLLESPYVTHAQSLELADLMDTVRAKVGVVFPGEK